MSNLNLRPEDIDRLGQALLTLTQELWIVKDRQRVLEAALIEANLLPPDTVDQYQPDEKLAALLETDRADLINQIITTLAPTTD